MPSLPSLSAPTSATQRERIGLMNLEARLPAAVEVSGLIRAAEAQGGHGAVLRKGDAERGSIIVFIASRGRLETVLERLSSLDGAISWQRAPLDSGNESQMVASFLARRARFDEDFWAVELDIAEPERFIANLLPKG